MILPILDESGEPTEAEVTTRGRHVVAVSGNLIRPQVLGTFTILSSPETLVKIREAERRAE